MMRIKIILVALLVPLFSAHCSSDKDPVTKQLDIAYQRMLSYDISAVQELTMTGVNNIQINLPDVSPSGFELLVSNAQKTLEEIEVIDQSNLTHDEILNLKILKWHNQRIVDRSKFPLLRFPYTPYEWQLRGPNALLTSYIFNSDSAAERYLKLLDKYPDVLEGLHETLDLQINGDIYLQTDVASNIQIMFENSAQEDERNILWPTKERLTALSKNAKTEFYKKLPAKIDQINLALKKFSNRFDQTYMANTIEGYGLAQYPGGKEYYRALVRGFLNEDATPEKAYEAAWDKLYKIETELKSIRSEMGWKKDRKSFDEKLLKDKRFIASSAEDVKQRLTAYQNRLNPSLDLLFCKPPKYGYVIERASPAIEAALTFGVYEAPNPSKPYGAFLFNGANLESRSLLPSQALIYHEIDPGHHRQADAQATSEKLHPWRKHLWLSNSGEAWGEYAQILAYEAGVFETPEEKYARLLFNSMFPARAVAEIGINYYGKSFDWGLAVLKRYTLESDLQNRSSLRRDTSDWHGQILPYSLGAQELVRIRNQARFELGDQFDIRKYHEFILREGTVPTEILKFHVDWFVQQERSGKDLGLCN